MRTSNHTLRRTVGLAAAVAAIAAPAASAAPVDPPITGELKGSQQSGQSQQPGGDGYSSVTALAPPEPYTPSSVQVEPRTVAGDGFDWGDAGIGASAILALAAIAGGTALALGHSSRRGHKLA